MKQVNGLLWRGPRPYSYAWLAVNGFDYVIDLQSGAENKLTNTPLEYENPEDYGIKRIVIKCSNIFPPTFGQVNKFSRHLHRGKTYVHCHSGVDRTGFMVAFYRMHWQMWSFEDAYAEMVREGRHWWFFWWKRELKRYSKCSLMK